MEEVVLHRVRQDKQWQPHVGWQKYVQKTLMSKIIICSFLSITTQNNSN